MHYYYVDNPPEKGCTFSAQGRGYVLKQRMHLQEKGGVENSIQVFWS